MASQKLLSETILKKKRRISNYFLDCLLKVKPDKEKNLLEKFIELTETRLDSADPLENDKGMRNVMEILPYVISKEKSPAVVINNDNRSINGGAKISDTILDMNEYFSTRGKRMVERKSEGSDFMEVIEERKQEEQETPKIRVSHQILEVEEEED